MQASLSRGLYLLITVIRWILTEMIFFLLRNVFFINVMWSKMSHFTFSFVHKTLNIYTFMFVMYDKRSVYFFSIKTVCDVFVMLFCSVCVVVVLVCVTQCL